jgi:5-methylcytosine-specific restriction endonuclease McrA
MSPTDIPESVRVPVREAAQSRCGYCLSPQQYVMAKLEVEHLIPRAQGGSDDESNLWLSCSLCNRYKGAQVTGNDPLNNETVTLFNPRTQVWSEHFRWSPEGTHILGLTPIGRATVEALQLNNEIAVEVRRNWVLAGWHPADQ